MPIAVRLFVIAAGLSGGLWAAPLAIHLHATQSSPLPVGTAVGLAPRIENASKGMHVFRYAVSVDRGPYRIVRDFSQQMEFDWGPDLREHMAAVRVTVRNNESQETAEDVIRFQVVSRVKGKVPVVTPTAHPLVALFSAPPCPAGSQFRVAFHPETEEAVTYTPTQPCRPSLSNNVYVAGMRADTEYRMRSEVVNGSKVQTGGWLPFHTGMLDGSIPPVTVKTPAASGATGNKPVLVYAAIALGGGWRPFATDLQGRVIWYMRPGDLLTRVLPGGRFLALGSGKNSVNEMRQDQILREVDLAGNVIRETNAGRIAEQLASRGIRSDCRAGSKECLSGLHHEAIRLPNGHTLVVAGLERLMPAGTQGASEEVDILGDVVVDLDEDFQVAGLWNSFDHLDVQRKSYNNAKCHTAQGGCPPIMLKPEAYGWTHTNALNFIASSGDFLASIPEQEWIVKVDWKHGKGTGKILWRLGKGGDFKAETTEPNPWFSYAHDAGFEPAGSKTLTVLDNAEVYHEKDANVLSRAQIWQLDEQKMTAKLLHNQTIGGFANCCGTMQALKDGGYNALAGWVDFNSPHAINVEVDKDGKIVHAIEVQGSIVYRSFRVDDMYSASVK